MPIPLIGPQLTEGVSQMLWDFGFRHHADKQTKWIKGTAGLGMIADIVDETPETTAVEDLFTNFLSEENPKLLEAIRNSPDSERDKIVDDLERNFAILGSMLEKLKGS